MCGKNTLGQTLSYSLFRGGQACLSTSQKRITLSGSGTNMKGKCAAMVYIFMY